MQYVRQDIVQEEAENLIAFMLERDTEIRARLQRIAGLAEMQRKATRKNGRQEATRQGDFEVSE
jgi:flagellar biosynthesis/type III secretory pathway chaperone